IERNPLDPTFGFGGGFCDAPQDNLADAHRETDEDMARRFHHWDDIAGHFNGTVATWTAHGVSGLSRRALLRRPQPRAAAVAPCRASTPTHANLGARPASWRRRKHPGGRRGWTAPTRTQRSPSARPYSRRSSRVTDSSRTAPCGATSAPCGTNGGTMRTSCSWA